MSRILYKIFNNFLLLIYSSKLNIIRLKIIIYSYYNLLQFNSNNFNLEVKMIIETMIDNNVLHILFNGELDECTAGYTRDYLDNVIDKTNCNTIILNLKNLNFMDSTGIGVLIGRYKKLKNRDLNIFISNPNKTIEKIFNMSGLYEIMPKIS